MVEPQRACERRKKKAARFGAAFFIRSAEA
jgi:hypothetical protein